MKLTIEQLKNYLGTGLKCYGMGYFEDEYADNPKIPIQFEITGISNYKNEAFAAEVKTKEVDQEYLDINGDLFPLCYRLSDLDKFIPELGFVPIDWFRSICERDYEDGNYLVSQMFFDGSNNDLEKMPYGLIQKLFQWHFWPFGDEYFQAGLVIDKLKMTEK